MRLDAIGEVHLHNIIHSVFRESYLPSDFVRKVKLGYFVSPTEDITPRTMLRTEFWLRLGDALEETLRDYHKYEAHLAKCKKEQRGPFFPNLTT